MAHTKTLAVGLSALLVFPLLSGYSQETPSPATMPADLSAGATDVVKLAQSGVGEDVVLAYIKNSTTPYNLSADDILSLKNAGLSSPVLAAMLKHDNSLRSSPAQTDSEQILYPPANPTASVPATPAQPTAPTQPVAPAQPVASAQPELPTVPARHRPIVVEQPPPPPRLELVPAAPGPEYLWIPGHWSRHRGAWVWVGGVWKARPGPQFVWVGGHWARHGRGWTWIDGHWR